VKVISGVNISPSFQEPYPQGGVVPLKPFTKYLCILIFLVLFNLACALPIMNSATPTVNITPSVTQTINPAATNQPIILTTDQPLAEATTEPTSEPTPSGVQVGINHISFYYDTAIVSSITAEGVAANPPDPNNGAAWDVYPAFSRFNFNGYILQNTFHTPVIEVYPIQEYAAMNETAGIAYKLMNQVLIDRPANPTSLPFLPVFNAAQMMVSNVRYIDFKGGSGVRYLTQYGQSYYPISNYSVFYTFQGLTDDQKYYISAILPVNTSILPANDQIPNNDFQTFSNNFPSYIIDIQNQLNALPNESFTPDLSILDKMMQSIVEEIQ
jgi:hypothetical protein